jgi:hypothetical protein
MAIAKWATPDTRSSNIASTVLNSLTNGSESSVVTYDASILKLPQGLVTVKLGSINVTSVTGSILIRITINDGTDTADRVGGDTYSAALTTGTSAKVVVIPVRLYPFSLRLSVVNNAGVAFSSSGNEIYVRPWGEEVV